MGAQFGIQAGQAAINAGSGLLGSIFGLALENHNDWRQRQQQQKLTDIATNANKEIAQFNYDQQLKMWEATNYPAQKEQLLKAGLNPGLMYGMSGGGGATAAAAQAQGVGQANAPSGGGEVMGMGITGMQQAMMLAQIEVLKSQANKNNVEANKTGGVDTELGKTQIQSLTQGISNQKTIQKLQDAQTDAQEIENTFNGATLEQKIANYYNESSRIMANVRSAMNQADIDGATKETKIKQFTADLINKNADTALKYAQEKLTQSGIQVNDQQIQNMKAIIENMKQTQSFNRMALGQSDEKELSQRIQQTLKEAGAAGDVPAELAMDMGKSIIKIMTAGQAFKQSGTTYREGWSEHGGDWNEQTYTP